MTAPIEIDDVLFSAEYEWEAGERETRDYPGSPEGPIVHKLRTHPDGREYSDDDLRRIHKRFALEIERQVTAWHMSNREKHEGSHFDTLEEARGDR